MRARAGAARSPAGDRFIVAGRYSASLVRTEDGWRIAHRRRETWWTDGNPAVVSAQMRPWLGETESSSIRG